jgi:hypothetical protein
MQVWTIASGRTAVTPPESPFRPSTTASSTSSPPRFLSSFITCSQNLTPLLEPKPEDMTNMLGDQPALWQDRVMLDEDFFRALSDRPEPGCAMDRANPGRMRLARIDTLRHTRPFA